MVKQYQNVSIIDFIGAKSDGGCGDNRSYKTCQAGIKLSPPTNQHPVFHRPDALPVAQPTVSKHWTLHFKRVNRFAQKKKVIKQCIRECAFDTKANVRYCSSLLVADWLNLGQVTQYIWKFNVISMYRHTHGSPTCYLRQGIYDFTSVCLSVCLLRAGFAQKYDCGFSGQNYIIFQTFQGILYPFI